ncbi:MAG: hypothetical protein WBQ72_00135 [Terriglobales bacterium]|jgi:hypothetical protein
MPNLNSRLAALAILALPLLIAALIFGPTAFDLVFHRRPPERYLIPAGFTGWTRIEFRKKDAPPLPTEDGHRLLKLDAQGYLSTSSDPQTGYGNDDFYYYAPSDPAAHRTPISNAGVCKGGMIWELQTLVDEPTSTPFARFYVGSEAQYRHQFDPTERNLPACE